MTYSWDDAQKFCDENGYTHLSQDAHGDFWAVYHKKYTPEKILENTISWEAVFTTDRGCFATMSYSYSEEYFAAINDSGSDFTAIADLIQARLITLKQ